jgi:hypothetical protein
MVIEMGEELLVPPYRRERAGVDSDTRSYAFVIQELENAPTSIAMFLIEYVVRGGAQFLS